jgi:hypothetical protein
MKGVAILTALLFVFALVACSVEPETVEVTRVVTEIAEVEVEVTREIEVTREVEVINEVEVEVTREVEATREVEVEVTRVSIQLINPRFTPTPKNTPTITPTPSNTPLPTATPNVAQTATAQAWEQLTRNKGDGFYLVNVDIAPGLWRSLGNGDSCYWATTTRTGDIIDNHFGMAGGTAYIGSYAFQVEFDGCGPWEYLGQ